MSKPIILFVPGAWHSGDMYHGITTALSKLEYQVSVVSGLPSLDPQPPARAADASCAIDMAFLRDQHIVPLVEANNEIVVVAHSYGAVPAACAVSGWSKKARQASGQAGGVMGLVFVTGFLVPEGMTLAQLGGEHIMALIDADTPSPGLCRVKNPKDRLLCDVLDELAQPSIDALIPHAMSVFTTPQLKPAYTEPEFKGMLGYIQCLREVGITEAVVRGMIGATGAEWIVRRLDTSHDGFTHHYASDAAGLIDGFIAEFRKNHMHASDTVQHEQVVLS